MTPVDTTLSAAERSQLLQLAGRSIQHYLEARASLGLDREDYPETLHRWQSSFVTLHLESRLRGCIGNLQATRPLYEDIARNAESAAFRDPRFAPLADHEFEHLEFHISVLSTPQPLPHCSLDELLHQLRPGVDGVVLEDSGHRATFLPAVWEQLPRPELFIAQLLSKAGLDPAYWSEDIRVSTYTVESFATLALSQ